MKVGLIGLGRMGEGMSRRMLKAGIEVWGYRRNYAKAQEAYEAGYVSGVATNLESLVQIVHTQDGLVGKAPGIFQLVIPAELVEETLMSYYHFVWKVILLLIMAIAILKTLAGGRTAC